MATVDRTNNISVMYIRNFLAMYDNLDAECLDVGTLCTKANNMFSKYKPVRFPQDYTDSFPNWWKAQSGNCGINIPLVLEKTNFNGFDSILWQYEKPTGGDNSPYRFSDFEGYNPGALPVIYANHFEKEVTLNLILRNKYIFNTQNYVSGSESQLGLDNFTSGIQNTYFTVRISTADNTQYWFKSATEKASSVGHSEIEFDFSGLPLGNYTVLYLLTKDIITMPNPNLTGEVYTMYKDDVKYFNKSVIKLVKVSPVSMIVVGIANDMYVGNYNPLTSYPPYYPGSSGNQFVNNGNASIRILVTNTSDIAIAFDKNAIGYSITERFDQNDSTIRYFANIYDDSNNVLSVVTLQPGEQKYIRVFDRLFKSSATSTVPYDTIINTTILLHYRNINTADVLNVYTSPSFSIKYQS